jgi:hypothetical protein
LKARTRLIVRGCIGIFIAILPAIPDLEFGGLYLLVIVSMLVFGAAMFEMYFLFPILIKIFIFSL